jgi:hypothetical protein
MMMPVGSDGLVRAAPQQEAAADAIDTWAGDPPWVSGTMHEYTNGWHAGVERVAGLRQIGFIYITRRPPIHHVGRTALGPMNEARANVIHLRQRVGSGVRRAKEAAS